MVRGTEVPLKLVDLLVGGEDLNATTIGEPDAFVRDLQVAILINGDVVYIEEGLPRLQRSCGRADLLFNLSAIANNGFSAWFDLLPVVLISRPIS